MKILPNWSFTGLPEPEDSYGDLINSIAELGVRWALAGALAAERYRDRARLTTDVDLVVDWHPELVGTIERHGFDARVHQDAGDPPHLIRARAHADDRYVDFLVALTSYQQEALERAVPNDNVLTIEDVLVHKVIAWRPRDLDDIASILAAGHVIDRDYVRRWVEYFGFELRLEEAGLA